MPSHDPSPATYYYVPDLRAIDPSAKEMSLDGHFWIEPTVIEDEDLTFGGKSLSEWYEEERRRLSGSSSDEEEEERRGRQRMRREWKGESGKKQQ